ncbi:hypothetical protein [Acidovorax temperans]
MHSLPKPTSNNPHEWTLSLDDIRKSSELRDLLGHFDVEIGDHIHEDWYAISEIASFDSFGADGAGGRYILLPDQRILLISSEGSAGVIASDFVAFLDLVSGAPYWEDMLHFSRGGDLGYMTQAEELRRSDPRNDEDWPPELVAEFRGLAGLSAPHRTYAKTLHAAVTNGNRNPQVRSPDGTPYGNLFGSFKPTDNPRWRNA